MLKTVLTDKLPRRLGSQQRKTERRTLERVIHLLGSTYSCQCLCYSATLLALLFEVFSGALINIIQMLVAGGQMDTLRQWLGGTKAKNKQTKKNVDLSLETFIKRYLLHTQRAVVGRCTIHGHYHIPDCTEKDWHVCFCTAQPIISLSKWILLCWLKYWHIQEQRLENIFPPHLWLP